jgi:hypothetical protein
MSRTHVRIGNFLVLVRIRGPAPTAGAATRRPVVLGSDARKFFDESRSLMRHNASLQLAKTCLSDSVPSASPSQVCWQPGGVECPVASSNLA